MKRGIRVRRVNTIGKGDTSETWDTRETRDTGTSEMGGTSETGIGMALSDTSRALDVYALC